MGNSRFTNGTYLCVVCGKLTRETGSHESSVGLCKHCMEVGEYVNAIADGDMELSDVPEEFRKDVEKEV